MAQRWNDLLFAHWRVAPSIIASRLPEGLEVDEFDGTAWVGVIPFWMDRVRSRPFGAPAFSVPGAKVFAELNLRTYVRSRKTGLSGIFFFSLDAESALAVLGARVLFHLPYYVAKMRRASLAEGTIRYASDRLITHRPASARITYRSTGETLPVSRPGSLAHFLTERYCLFTVGLGRLLTGHIHHLPWSLERAEASFEVNDLAEYFGFELPSEAPVLYFSRTLDVYIWGLGADGAWPLTERQTRS